MKIDRTKWYRIKHKNLDELRHFADVHNEQFKWSEWIDHVSNLTRTIPETTTENTTETTKNRYVTFASHDYTSSIIYNKLYKQYFNSEHPRVNEEDIYYIREQLQEIYYEYGEYEFRKLVEYHFENIPKDNDGKAQYFLAVKDRYLKEENDLIFFS